MCQSRSYKNIVSLSLIEVYSLSSVFFCVLFTADDCADCRGFPPDCSCEDYFSCKSQGCATGECQPYCPGMSRPIWACLKPYLTSKRCHLEQKRLDNQLLFRKETPVCRSDLRVKRNSSLKTEIIISFYHFFSSSVT